MSIYYRVSHLLLGIVVNPVICVILLMFTHYLHGTVIIIKICFGESKMNWRWLLLAKMEGIGSELERDFQHMMQHSVFERFMETNAHFHKCYLGGFDLSSSHTYVIKFTI